MTGPCDTQLMEKDDEPSRGHLWLTIGGFVLCIALGVTISLLRGRSIWTALLYVVPSSVIIFSGLFAMQWPRRAK